MDTRTVLQELCNAAGTGSLREAGEIAAAYLHPYMDEVRIDTLGNVCGQRRCGNEQAPTLLLEAHIDEIGFIVTRTDEKGFAHVSACGGVDRRVLSACEVVLWGTTPVKGVFTSTPPHLSKPDDKLPEISDWSIDTGLDGKQAKKRLPPGTCGTFAPHFENLGEHGVCAKALDDRAGVAAILYALDQLGDALLSCNVAVVFAVQEELGQRGAEVAAYTLAPAQAIAVDVSFAHTPDADRSKCGELGKGAMLGWSPTLSYAITKQLERLAGEAGLPLQHEVMGGDTGTDADVISTANSGVPAALLSIPLRYMHTPSEVADIRDVETVGMLLAAYIEKGEHA